MLKDTEGMGGNTREAAPQKLRAKTKPAVLDVAALARARIGAARPRAPAAPGEAPEAPAAAGGASTVISEGPTASAITIITSIGPPTTGKAYKLEPDGSLTKKAVASIWNARARIVEVPTAEAMVTVLEQTTQSHNQALVLNGFKNGIVDQPFRIVTEPKLEQLLGQPVADEGIYDIEHERVAARLKRGVTPSAWILIDADNPPGMPMVWTDFTLEERLKLFEPILPGAAACERVEYLGSSARVVKAGGDEKPPFATHALVRVSNSERIDTLREYLKVTTVIESLSFQSPRYSKREPGKIIGHEQRTLIDISVMVAGRIVFVAKPDVSNAPGYEALPAGARIVNPGGGVLDIGSIELPAATALARYNKNTGLSASFSGASGNLSVTVRNVLKLETEIEVKGAVKPLFEWLAGMTIGDKLRCEAPFRASKSEAAFIRKDGETDAILYDSGTSTTYPLMGTFPDISDEELDSMSTPDPVIVEMNARYVFIESLNAIFDLRPGKLRNGEKKMPQIVPERGMRARYKNKIFRVTKKGVITRFDHWFEHPKRAEFDDIGCYPPDKVSPRHLNMFEGFAVPSVQGSWKELERFVREIICGKEPGAYDYLYELVCWWLQNPCTTPEVSIVLLGSQGLGKGVFVLEFLGGLLGRRHLLHFTNPKALVADHNEEWAGQLLMFFNEMTYGHDKAISGMLKALDTEDEIRINPKFVKAYSTPNLSLKVYATNEASGGLPLDHDDRRKLVLDVATSKKEDHAYFENLTRALRNGELSAFLYDALREDLTGFNRRKVYKTRARTEIADTTASLETSFLVHVLEQGILFGEQWTPRPISAAGGWIAVKGNAWPTSEVAISTEALYTEYLDWVRCRRGKTAHPQAELFREFKKALGDKFDKDRIRVPGNINVREYRYRFASLGDCQAAFDAFCGRPREWASKPSAQILPFPVFDANGEELV